MSNNKYCVNDCEGTGINFRTEYITQIAAVVLENKSNELKTFNSLVRSPKSIPPNIEDLTGIKSEDVLRAPDFQDVYTRFVEFIEDTVLITQAGYEYDVPLLEQHCENECQECSKVIRNWCESGFVKLNTSM